MKNIINPLITSPMNNAIPQEQQDEITKKSQLLRLEQALKSNGDKCKYIYKVVITPTDSVNKPKPYTIAADDEATAFFKVSLNYKHPIAAITFEKLFNMKDLVL